MLAPIILFTYNRPWHTCQTVEALKKNELATQSDLIIFSDAPKSTQAEQSVQEVREFLRTIDGFNSVKIIERNENWGLAKSIIDGVTDVVNEYGRVIVLEDDIVTSPFFLRYMNEALNLYQNESEVMHISGYNYPIVHDEVPDTFFVKPTTCWGWATWDRAWKYYKKDCEYYLSVFDKNMIKDFNLNHAYNYFSQIKQNYKGLLDTWAIFWYASLYLRGGLSLHPRMSFTHNIGHDGQGQNCNATNVFDTQLVQEFTAIQKVTLVESTKGRVALEDYFNSIKVKFHRRLFRKIKSIYMRN